MASSVVKLLQNQLKALQNEPVEGVFVEPSEEDLFQWSVWIEGPAGTPYAGGVFLVRMAFPRDFPMSPPSMRFVSEFWHPNVYTDGKVCMSVLHPPGEDEMSGEAVSERWLPTRGIDSVLLSFISLLSDPNTSSPANVDASVEWRRDKARYLERVKRLCTKSKRQVPQHVKIPHPDSNPEEHQRQIERIRAAQRPAEMDEFEEFMELDDDGGDDDFDGDCFDDENEEVVDAADD